MNHAPALAPVPTPYRRQLAGTTVLVVAIHALLVLGLPHLRQTPLAGQDAGTFVTRLIAPPAPAPSVEPQPVAPPTPLPQPDKPAEPKPKPRPAKSHPAQPSQAPTPPSTSAAESPRTPATSRGSVDAAVSLLTPKPVGDFGGAIAPMPIQPPLSSSEAAPALKLAQDMGDAPIRLARAAVLSYQAAGTIDGQEFTVPTPVRWRQDGQWYEIRWGFYNPKVGEQTRSTIGLIAPQGLVPVRAESRTPDAQEIGFDYNTRQVWFSAAGAHAPLVPGAVDRLSVLFQLGALLGGDPARYPVGSTIELPAAHLRGAGLWSFVVEPNEDLPALGDQTVPTIRLVHAPHDQRDARIEVWLGPTLDYLPVRLRVTEPTGDHVEYNLARAYSQPTPTNSTAPALGTPTSPP